MLGPGLTYLLLAVAPSVAWLLLGYVVAGIVGAVYTTTNAYVADVTPQEERAGRYGMLGAAFGLGFIVGPLAGGLLGGLGLRVPLYVAGGFTLLNMILCFFLLAWRFVRPAALAAATPAAQAVTPVRDEPTAIPVAGVTQLATNAPTQQPLEAA